MNDGGGFKYLGKVPSERLVEHRGKLTHSHGRSRHGEGCECPRCTGFRPGNDVAVVHGATSERKIVPLLKNHRRRVLRQLRLSPHDLDPIGRGYLDQYVRAMSKVDLIDRYVAEHGLIREDGSLQPCMKLYVSLLNAARTTLARFTEHVQRQDLVETLDGYLANRYGLPRGGE